MKPNDRVLFISSHFPQLPVLTFGVVTKIDSEFVFIHHQTNTGEYESKIKISNVILENTEGIVVHDLYRKRNMFSSYESLNKPITTKTNYYVYGKLGNMWQLFKPETAVI